MAAAPPVPAVSSTTLLERLGSMPVEHGRNLCGLSMKDVFEQVRDTALAAAKQKQSESSSRSQNLLRAYCRARLALEELQSTASKYGVMPRTIPGPNPQDPSAAFDPSLQMDMPTFPEASIVPWTPSSTTSPKPVMPCRTTKGGRFRPLAVRTAPLQDLKPQNEEPALAVRGFAWVQEDLAHRAMYCWAWALHRAPLCIHLLWIFALAAGLYLATRPQLLVRLAVWACEHTFRIATTSGSDLLWELDKLLLTRSHHLTRPVLEAKPLAWAWICFAARPANSLPDMRAVVEAAASQATAGISAQKLENASVELQAVAKAAASIAAAGAAQQVSSVAAIEHAPDSPAPSGAGFGILLVVCLTLSKAGKLLG